MERATDISEYEGLVFKTASMFHQRVGLEMDDMRQELRIRVLKARGKYDPSLSKMTEQAFVYACLANFVKDLKRDAARRSAGRLSVTYIENYERPGVGLAAFEARYLNASHDEIYGAIEDGTFVLPSTITPDERNVLLLLVLHFPQTEISTRLGIDYAVVGKLVRSIRVKLADWRPSVAPEAVVPPAVPVAA